MARIHRLYKKDVYDPNNHNGVITHLESDILECEIKWAVGSITANKASGGDGIPVELFQIIKDDAVKYMEFRKMVMITRYARQQKRNKCIEQTFGLCGRGRRQDDLGEWH